MNTCGLEPGGGRILVIDDDIHVRAATATILEKRGHGVVSFGDGNEALAYFREECCDLVLADVRMPGMSGIELLGHLRERDPDVPVILMTAYADLDTAINAIRMGAFDFIVKPYDPGNLLASLNKGIRFRRLCRLEREHAARIESALAEKTRELQELHGQLVFSEKMATIGQLMAGIAHEINNPIGYVGANLKTLEKYAGRIIGFITYLRSLAEKHLDDEIRREIVARCERDRLDVAMDDCHNLICESAKGIEQVRNIILDLKTFSRKESVAAEPVDINQTLESVISIVWNELKYVAEVHRDFSCTAPVLGSTQKLGQVFLNLLINASQAIRGYGEITVKTWQESDRVCVSITDTGCGIPDHTLSRIFEPFFTTKEEGKGTGLGLSISGDIVRKHGGTIEVRSETGKGSTFTVVLPALATR